MIDRPEGLPGGAGRRAGQPGRRAGRLARHCRGRSAADPLRRPAALRRGAVRRAARDARRAALGPVRHARGARPRMRPQPRASGYFRTSYARGLRARSIRARRRPGSRVLRRARWRLPFLAGAVRARPRQPGAARLDRRGGADAAHRLRRARSRSATPGCSPPAPSPPGILFKEFGAPFWVTLPAAAAVGALLGLVFGLPSAAPARPLPCGIDAGAAFHRDLSRRRVRDQARLLHRHRDRSAAARRLGAHDARGWYFVLLAAAAATRAARAQPAALAHRPRLARDPRPRGGRRGARHQRAARTSCSAFVVSLDAHRGRGLRSSPTTAASSRPRRSRSSSPSSTSR